jgi:mono/diheme cytochrome c family protein
MRTLPFMLLIAGAVQAQPYDLSDFHALGRRWQPAPEGHRVGKDSGPGAGLHNAGEDCAICHTPGGKAANYVFTIAGTLYADRAAQTPLAGAEVVLQDASGQVLSMTSNRVGNFWSYAPIASHPRTVASHSGHTFPLFGADPDGGFVPADPEDSRTWLYKAWIRTAHEVRPMVSIVPVGGANGTTPRMSCNMHHSPIGSSGALWASVGPSLTGYPSESVSFRRHVQPLVASRCAPCHIPGARRTRLVVDSDLWPDGGTALDYSAGLDLTSLEGSTYSVAQDGGTTEFVKGGVRDLVDLAAPARSPLLQKSSPGADGAVHHAGGLFWRPGEADYEVIRRWIAEGAAPD